MTLKQTLWLCSWKQFSPYVLDILQSWQKGNWAPNQALSLNH